MYDPEGFAGDHLYLDANVLIYAVEGFKPYDAFLRELFELIQERHIKATTSQITLAEVLVGPLRAGRSDLVLVYEEMFSEKGSLSVLPVTREVLAESAALRARTSAKAIDAIHVATARLAGVDFFMSDDRRLDPAPIEKLMLAEAMNG